MTSPYVDKLIPWSSHTIILKWLASYPPKTKVLDVGTATGVIGRMIADNHLSIYGIEPNPVWLEACRPFYQDLYCGHLDETPDDFLRDYEVVVCADVLEHMANPEKSLNHLVSLQTQNANFIISVPNVANIWVRINLLLGRFDYSDRGILDYTHLRFFTRKSLRKMVESSLLTIKQMTVTPIPIQLINPFFERTIIGLWIYHILSWITQLLPSLFGYQFVLLCSKKKIK